MARFFESTRNLAGAEIEVKKVHMDSETRRAVTETVAESLHELPRVDFYRELSRRIKSTMDRRFGSPWHCVVGERFACNTSNDGHGYIHLKVGPYLHVIVYKTSPGPPKRTSANDKSKH
ncbi:hypothetical protein QR680_013381 [Steinernema hermaphroditum]|uniref:Dynein light chain n=1 Tax=Steinernema hermaphroditum TaxID=289476 RepID=A0AA39I5C1_9BILA|nr:hypothetical protein QR680_013381 [Steinernema hermaphroditum]